jgi:outer membrane protein assembly factor BamD (BamD/ComL family)
LMRVGRQAEALPYFERLIQEYQRSEYLDDARRRVEELKAQADRPAG